MLIGNPTKDLLANSNSCIGFDVQAKAQKSMFEQLEIRNKILTDKKKVKQFDDKKKITMDDIQVLPF